MGQFVTVTSPVDATVYGKVSRAATALQVRAVQEKRKAILVLEITGGVSRYGDVRELARFLSMELPAVTTVAWIPEDVRGYNVILALACNEIIMHPKAGLGDIGRGKLVERDTQSFVVDLVNRRHNPKVTEALVLGMMDPQKEVVWVRLKVGDPPVGETRVVSPVEFDRLRDNKALIEDQRTIKAAGTDAMFTGSQARALTIMVTQTAETRGDVANIYKLAREALREDPSSGAAPRAKRIRLEGSIGAMQREFITRQMRRAIAGGANLLIFEIDSPGGTLHDSTELAYAISDCNPKEVRTVAFIPKRAISGGAIVSLGCDEIYMLPEASLGDAGPIEMRAGGVFEHVDVKIVSWLREQMQSLANKKGRPAAICMAMADKDLTVYQVTSRKSGDIGYMTEAEIHAANDEWVKGAAVPESGPNRLLTVRGQRAHTLKLAEPPIEDFSELKQRLGIPADEEVFAIGATWVDDLVFILNDNWVTGVLFVLGILCIYAELHMATGFFGICGAVCFSLFFWSHYLGGTADWLEVVLFLVGVGCIALEIFLLPGFLVFGFSGGLLIVVSLLLASQTFIIPASRADYDELLGSLGTLSGAIVGFVAIALLIGRFLPRMTLLNQMVLVPPGSTDREHWNEPQLAPEYTGARTSNPLLEQDHSLIGRTGVTLTILRPAGKAQIDGKFVDVVSDGPFIEQGTAIEVLEVNGNRVVVRQA